MDFEKQQQAFRTSKPSLIGRGFEKIPSPVGGAVAGFVNTLAGGGSFLTVPLLIFVGLPPTVVLPITGTIVSPWPPRTKAETVSTETSNS